MQNKKKSDKIKLNKNANNSFKNIFSKKNSIKKNLIKKNPNKINIKKIISDIKSLRIQGASKVTSAAENGLVDWAQSSKEKNFRKFLTELKENYKQLRKSRPTEPQLRNALDFTVEGIEKTECVEAAKEILEQRRKSFELEEKRAEEKIAEYGNKLIEKGSTVMTICHSHTLVNMLIKSKNKIKEAYCLETRPLFQGRITAFELAKAGIKTNIIVDSAAFSYLKKCDYFFSGADALLADGDVVNKIGTAQVSLMCQKFSVPHYVVCHTLKFDRETAFGKNEKIEQRNPDEIWDRKLKPKRIIALNPAFDRTDSRLIEGIISEQGITPSTELAERLFQTKKK